MKEIIIIGAGLAGSEAALQIARRGIRVRLCEMRPTVTTPAHKTGLCAELVCSNSLKSKEITAPHGLLKEELIILGSALISLAEQHAVPAGNSLAVNREAFARAVTDAVESHPCISVERVETTEIPREGISIVSAGPLISQKLSAHLAAVAGQQHLFFFDAVAPVVEASSIDMGRVFAGSRYEKGSPDFLNCSMNKKEYLDLYQSLISAEQHELHGFEEGHFFEGCLPVEEIARRGERSLSFGPLRPVGFIDPRTNKRPWAVVQLRREDAEGRLYNMVGFQTRLTEKEQERVFRKIPGLQDAVFARYGKMHRNTFLCAPAVLDSFLRLKVRPQTFIAGQLSGSEGYTEAIATGLLCGINAARAFNSKAPGIPSPATAIGALIHHLTGADEKGFQPMNFNFGLLPEISPGLKDKQKKRMLLAQKALSDIAEWKLSIA